MSTVLAPGSPAGNCQCEAPSKCIPGSPCTNPTPLCPSTCPNCDTCDECITYDTSDFTVSYQYAVTASHETLWYTSDTGYRCLLIKLPDRFFDDLWVTMEGTYTITVSLNSGETNPHCVKLLFEVYAETTGEEALGPVVAAVNLGDGFGDLMIGISTSPIFGVRSSGSRSINLEIGPGGNLQFIIKPYVFAQYLATVENVRAEVGVKVTVLPYV